MYGVDLTTLVKTHGTKLPAIVKDSIEELESRGKLANHTEGGGTLSSWCLSIIGLGLEGIYRVSGKTAEVLQIKKSYDQG